MSEFENFVREMENNLPESWDIAMVSRLVYNYALDRAIEVIKKHDFSIMGRIDITNIYKDITKLKEDSK